MKVSKVGSGKGPDRTRKKENVSGSGGAFAAKLRDVAGAQGQVAGVDGVHPAAGIDSILALQEVGDATEDRGRKQAFKYGEDILDRLEDMRRDILLGRVSKDELTALAQKIRAGRGHTNDPKLGALLDEIELRAEVEIAKLTRGA